jgi:hypothetical protein
LQELSIRCPCCNEEIKIIVNGSKIEVSNKNSKLTKKEISEVLKEKHIDLG